MNDVPKFRKHKHSAGSIVTMKDGRQFEVQKDGSWRKVILSSLGYVIAQGKEAKRERVLRQRG